MIAPGDGGGRRWWFAPWLALLGITLAAVSCRREPIEVLSIPVEENAQLRVIKALPDFTLTERSGKPFGSADFTGHVTVADFFYTTCPGPCAALSKRMSDVQAAVASLESVRLVSISSDPVRDTPEVLQRYAERFGAGPRWFFLTGAKDAIFDLANKGFLLSLTEDAKNTAEPITHSSKMVLIDRQRRIRGYYEGLGEDEIGRLVKDVKRLTEESP